MDKKEMRKIVEENIDRLEKNDFSFLFYVLDTKGNPSSALEYIYKTAMVLHKKGYNVKMIHNEKEKYITLTTSCLQEKKVSDGK